MNYIPEQDTVTLADVRDALRHDLALFATLEAAEAATIEPLRGDTERLLATVEEALRSRLSWL